MVTSYVNFYRTPIPDHGPRLRELRKILDLEVPLVIFATPDTIDALSPILTDANHVRVIVLSSNFFLASFMYLTAKHSSAWRLPTQRLEPKDTYDYMCYQHSKVEFIYQASVRNYFQTDFFAWVDYDIMRNFNVSEALKHLYRNNSLKTQTIENPKNHIYFPGCWDYQVHSIQESLCEKICWRFCGWFFIGKSEAIVHLHTLYLAHYDSFLETYKTMVWDVNFWAYLEQEKSWKPIVYKANHDASLIENFPLRGYAKKLSVQKRVEYSYPILADYNPSSASYIQWQGEQLLNVRYVNYRYLPSGHCTLRPDRKICTVNLMTRLVNDIQSNSGFHEMKIVDQEISSPELPMPDPNEQYQGVEDIRLYQHNGTLKFIATSVNYSGCASNRMIYGKYDIDDHQLKNIRVIHSDKKEKNWVPFESRTEPRKEYFVYKWNPMFQLAEMKEDGKKVIVHSHITTSFFPYKQMIRGSSNIVFDSHLKSYVAIVHICEENSLPKEYFHMLIWLDYDTYQPTAFSKLFYFDAHGPEFCLSMKATKDQYIFWISRLDRDPVTVFVNKKSLEPKCGS
jgi:hypothetical protein